MTTATAASLNYGPMKRPEKKGTPQADEDMVSFVRAAYNQWVPIAQELMKKRIADDALEKGLMAEIEPLLAPKRQSLGSLDAGQNLAVLDIPNAPFPLSQYFLNALLKYTNLPFVGGAFLTDDFGGFCVGLGRDRTLAVDKLSRSGTLPSHLRTNLGTNAHGNICNFATVGYFAMYATSGVQANFGKVRDMGQYARGGMQVNMSEAEAMGTLAAGGLQINNARATHLGSGLYPGTNRRSTQLNLGSVRSFVQQTTDSYMINAGEAEDNYLEGQFSATSGGVLTKKTENGKVQWYTLRHLKDEPRWARYEILPEATAAKLSHLEQRIREELGALEQLKGLDPGSKQMYEAAINLDFQGLRSRVTTLVGWMKRLAR